MALPVPESAAGSREDIIRLLMETPDGLSDGELALALADRHPALNAKAANHQCRKLAAAGMVERVGTRPVRTRLVAGVAVEPPETDADPPLEGQASEAQVSEGQVSEAQVSEAQAPEAHEGHTTQLDRSPELSDVPLAGGRASTSGLSPVQEDIVRALVTAPEGLTDNGLAAALVDRYPDVDPKSFNYQCRKLAKAGLVERSARSRDAPIRTRLTGPTPDLTPVEGDTTQAEHPPEPPDVPLAAAADTDEAPQPAPANGNGNGNGNGTGVRSRRPRRRPKAPSDDVASMRRSERDGDDPDEPLLRFLPFAPAANARTALRERMAERAALRRVPDPSDEVVVPTRDVLQGWSRTQNVAAAVADWITRHGGTIHAATATGPAHDLVASVHGDDVHVEVTGWPPDGARSHPTTLAGDWFRAAARAASQRRRAHPRGRVVIALPDTRRYRALADDDTEALRRARAEVWFVDPSGEVQRS